MENILNTLLASYGVGEAPTALIIFMGSGLIVVGCIILLLAYGIAKKGLEDMISGYNSLTNEQKEKIDKEAMKFFISTSLVVGAISTIVGGIAFIISETEVAMFTVTGTFIGAIVIGIIFEEIFQKTRKKGLITAHKTTMISISVISTLIIIGSTICAFL